MSKIFEINVPSGKESQNHVELYRIPKKPTMRLQRRSIKKIRKNQAKALSDKVFRQPKKPINLAKRTVFVRRVIFRAKARKRFTTTYIQKATKAFARRRKYRLSAWLVAEILNLIIAWPVI
jgi:hypothetical protein